MTIQRKKRLRLAVQFRTSDGVIHPAGTEVFRANGEMANDHLLRLLQNPNTKLPVEPFTYATLIIGGELTTAHPAVVAETDL